MASVIGTGRLFLRDISRARSDLSVVDASPVDLLGRAQVWTAANPSRSREGSESASHRCWRRMRRGGGRGEARRGIPLQRHRQRHVEDDRDGRPAMLARDGEELGARPVLDVRGVDHGQPAAAQPHREDAVEEVEGVVGGALRARARRRSSRAARRRRGPRSARSGRRRRCSCRWRRSPISRTSASGGRTMAPETDRPPRSSAVGGRRHGVKGSALGVAVRAHLRVGDRGLRLTGGARKGAAADRGAGLADEMDLAEVTIRQAPRHIATLTSGGRGHRAGLRLRKPILPEIAPFHKPAPDLAACCVTT